MPDPVFTRLAGACALLSGPGALAYAALFISIVEGNHETAPWFAVLLGGALLTVPVQIALYQRLRSVSEGFALLAFLLGLGGALGGVLHAGYELASIESPPSQGYYPGLEAVSKGVLRYFVAGLALLLIGLLVHRSRRFARGLAYLAAFGGVLLVVIYFGRLFDFVKPGDYARLIPPIVYGFVVHPLFYGWLGVTLWRSAREALADAPATPG
jgi:hypothetical protein